MERFDFVFERELNFRFGDKVEKGLMTVGRVEKLNDQRWVCYWSIAYINPERAKIYGEDSLQAATRCLNFLSNLIKGHEEDGWKVWWRYEGDHGGLDFIPFKEGMGPNSRGGSHEHAGH